MQNIGARRVERVKTGVRQTIAISLGLTLIISGTVCLLSGSIITPFALSDQAAFTAWPA